MELHQPDEEGFISGVHNYCDRWCERCRFVAQCRVGIEELDAEEGGFKERTNEQAMEEVQQNMRNAMAMLRQMAEEQGIDMEQVMKEARASGHAERRQARREERLENDPLCRATMDYAVQSHGWVKERREAMREAMIGWAKQAEMGVEPEQQLRKAERLSDALELLERYAMSIASKTNRAVEGQSEGPGYYDEEIGPFQTDYNGSAKLAILLVEHSLAAWGVILELFPAFADDALPLLARLKQALEGLKQTFPDAHRFIRPGFDAPAA